MIYLTHGQNDGIYKCHTEVGDMQIQTSCKPV